MEQGSRREKPELPTGYLGAQPKFSEWGLAPITHRNPDIATDKNPLEIKINTPKPMKVTCNLLDGHEEEKAFSDLVFTQTLGEIVTLVIAFPKPGFYKLQIYALPAEDESKSLPNVYNYLIQNLCPPKGQLCPFPKQYAQWKQDCYLYEPMRLDDVADLDTVPFKVRIPGAKAVALTVESEWFHLEKNREGVWEGVVKNLSRFKGKGKASLNANYGGDESKYSSLLEYQF